MYRAAARTWVRDFFSCLRNPLAFGSGSIWDLQNIIMSQKPSHVVFIAGGGGGIDSGKTVPIGRESCRVGGMVATKMRVICSGVTAVASSASPFATWAWAEWAFARSKKTSAIRLHTSELGSFCWGSLPVIAPRMCFNSRTFLCSFMTFGWEVLGLSSLLIHLSSTSCLSGTTSKIVWISAPLILSHTRLNASWYVVTKFLYASSLSSEEIDEIELSNIVSASSMESKNLDVTVGCLAAADTILPELGALGAVFGFAIMLHTISRFSKILGMVAIFLLRVRLYLISAH